MTHRIWVAIYIFISFLLLAATGVLIFVIPYSSFWSGTHTIFGLITFCIALLHIRTNFKALKNYLSRPSAFLVALSLIGLLFTLIIFLKFQLSPVTDILNFGSKLRKTAIVHSERLQVMSINLKDHKADIIIDVRVGSKYRDRKRPFYFGRTISSTPQAAFWIENSDGNLIQHIFSTSSSTFEIIHGRNSGISGLINRPEALPYWRHKYLKAKETLAVDGTTGATPHGHFKLSLDSTFNDKDFTILAEVNRSFDFNSYYTPDKYPDDPVYSGDGYPGQPSIVYAAHIDLSAKKRFYVMEVIGHGHHSGKDGKLHTNMEGIDSALEIFDRIIVEITQPPLDSKN